MAVSTEKLIRMHRFPFLYSNAKKILFLHLFSLSLMIIYKNNLGHQKINTWNYNRRKQNI